MSHILTHKERFKRSVLDAVERGYNPCTLIAHDLKLDRWFVVTKLEQDTCGTVISVEGFDISDYDKDGYTWRGGRDHLYCGRSRYRVFHRESRIQLRPIG